MSAGGKQNGERESGASTFRKVYPFIRPFRKRILWLMVATGFLSILAMLPPLFTRAVINDVIGSRKEDLLPGLIVCMLAVPVLHATISFLQVLGIAFLGQKFVLDVRMAVYNHLLNLHIGFFGKFSTGKLINRLMGDSTTMQQILGATSIQVISDLVCSLFAISATLYINWRLSLPILIIVGLFVLNYRMNIRKLRQATRRWRNSADRLAAGVQNRLTANMTVKTFATETREDFIFSGQSEETTQHAHDSWLASSTFAFNTQLLQEVGRVTIYFLGCAMVLDGSANYGDVTAFTTYTMQILWPAVRFSQLAEQLQNVRISTDRLFEILDQKPEITSKKNAVQLANVRGRVDLNKVSFEYVPEHPVIRELDLHVKPGQTIALVGPTGCGKTTVLSLIMRLYDVKTGSVCIDGMDVRDVELSSLRRQFGIVLQESLLFTVSIADNIRYARPDASMEEVVNAAKIAEIHEDILGFRKGYDSVIGERDVQLSIGQKQRISIARAVLANPSIIIMDEATSSLDSESEKAIQLAMDRFLKGRTSFIVAHRLSTIRNADRILLLDRGVVVESGSHDELVAIPNGRYRDLYEKHAGKGVITDEHDE